MTHILHEMVLTHSSIIYHNPISHPDAPKPHLTRHRHVCEQPVPYHSDLTWFGDSNPRSLTEMFKYLSSASGLLGRVSEYFHSSSVFEKLGFFPVDIIIRTGRIAYNQKTGSGIGITQSLEMVLRTMRINGRSSRSM